MAEEKKENAAEEVANQTPEATTDAPTPKAEKVDVEAEASKTEETEEAPKKEAIEVPTEAVDYKSVEPLDDFDWDSIGKTKDNYKEEARKEMEEAYNETLTSIAEHEVLEGKIVTLTKKEAVINIGYKSEGIIPISEFRYNPDLKVGDGVEVYVDSQEDKNGQLVLSHKKHVRLKLGIT